MACATGQLTAGEFEQAVRLFVDRWQAAVCSSSGQQLCWILHSVRMPVTHQAILYAELERIVPAGSADQKQQMQPVPPAAAAAAAADELQTLHQQQQQQQQQQLDAVVPVQAELAADDDEAAVSSKIAAAGPCHAADAESGAAGADLARAQQQQQQQHVHQYSIVYHDMYKVPVLYLRACKPDGQPLSLGQLLQDLPALQRYREASQPDWTFITQMEHPLQRTPCVMLHPCQTAARMQLLLQDQRSTAAAGSAAGTALASSQDPPVQPADNSRGRGLSGSAPAAAAAAAVKLVEGCGGRQLQGFEPDGRDDPLLLLYMQAWFSMVAGLLGIDMLPFFGNAA